jgi:hypothetical protein
VNIGQPRFIFFFISWYFIIPKKLFVTLNKFFKLRTGCKWVDMLIVLVLLCMHFKIASMGTFVQWLLTAFFSQRLILKNSPLYSTVAARILSHKPSAYLLADGEDLRPVLHVGRVQCCQYTIAFLLRPEYIWLAATACKPLEHFTHQNMKYN